MAMAKEYADLAKGITCEQFAAKHPYSFLLLRIGDEDDSDEWTFKTTTVSTRRTPTEEQGVMRRSLNQFRVFPITKSADNPWAGRISVGRARNNDIALAHKSISKLHAHFITEAEGDGDGDGELKLSDAGSRNGTKVNGDRLESGSAAGTKPGDEITFGAVSVKHMDAAALYDFLHGRDEV